eukprot:CAMPEP_0174727846 /NCGR_PEP_ID=MMETSP1094-20130205/50598_1 /TAXON_ID=156173 /ORGANISM="Chrysochromulina brevifilum, Strain UTEX LB 985" /LENGTH=174 /DNA_ID=CAMNT_0015929675 /DNA_START=60 /DNA_END=584 /DNA_ORIENTATION=+
MASRPTTSMGLTMAQVNSSNLYRFEPGYRGSGWPTSFGSTVRQQAFVPGARPTSSYDGYRPLPVTPVSPFRPTVALRTLKMPNGRPITLPQPQHGRGAVPFHDLSERPPAVLVEMQATRYVELDADRSPLRYGPASLIKTHVAGKTSGLVVHSDTDGVLAHDKFLTTSGMSDGM